MENIKTFQDSSGTYIGQTENGVPHGKGIKSYQFGLKVECNWSKGLKTGRGSINFGLLNLSVKFSKGYPKRLINQPEIFKFSFPKSFSFNFPVLITEDQGIYHESISSDPIYFSLCCFEGEFLNNSEFIRRRLGKLRKYKKGDDWIVTESTDESFNGYCEVRSSDKTLFGVYENGLTNRINEIKVNQFGKIIIVYDQNMNKKFVIRYSHRSDLKIKTVCETEEKIFTTANSKYLLGSGSNESRVIRGIIDDFENIIPLMLLEKLT